MEALSQKLLAKVSTLRYGACMFKLPDFPSVDFSKFDLDALRNLDLSKYVPAVNFPTIDMPNADIDVSKLTDAVRDAAYLTVGLGAAAVEQAQARARELADTISDGFEATKVHTDALADKIEAILPDKVATLFGQAREMSDAARVQVIGLIRNAA